MRPWHCFSLCSGESSRLEELSDEDESRDDAAARVHDACAMYLSGRYGAINAAKLQLVTAHHYTFTAVTRVKSRLAPTK